MASSPPRSEALRRALAGLVAERLPAVLPGQRWFGSKGRRIAAVALRDAAPLAEGAPTWLALVEVAFADGAREVYALPLALVPPAEAPAEGFGRLAADGATLVVADALDDPAACRALLAAIEEEATVRTPGGAVRFRRTAALPRGPLAPALSPRRLQAEQTNTSVVFGELLILKHLRRIAAGLNPDYEVSAFLTTRTRFRQIPLLCGAIEYRDAAGQAATLALLQRFVPNRGDAWTWVVEHLGALRDFVAARAVREPLGPARLEQLVRDFAAPVLQALGRLGEVTAELHAALASVPDEPAFAPEPIRLEDTERWATQIGADLGRTLAAVRQRLRDLDPAARGDAEAVLAGEAALAARLADLRVLAEAGCARIRIHGDYHLGQALRTDEGFVILDFEGEPARSLDERRAKRCALVDVAGLLRSLDYAAGAARREAGAPWAEGWVTLAERAFLAGYRGAAARAPVRLLPAAEGPAARALVAFALDKALYEVRYEIDNRPAWLPIPLGGLRRLLTRPPAP